MIEGKKSSSLVRKSPKIVSPSLPSFFFSFFFPFKISPQKFSKTFLPPWGKIRWRLGFYGGRKVGYVFFLYTLARISIPFFSWIFSISQFWLGFILTPPPFSFLKFFYRGYFFFYTSFFLLKIYFLFVPPHLEIFLFFISYSRNTLTPS